MAKFRPPTKATKGLYEQDYAVGSALLPVAAKHRAAIVLIAHTRKGESDDPLEMISGTTGLSGGVDNIMLLRRSRFTESAELSVTGRDIEDDQIYSLGWDKEACRWVISGTGPGALLTPERKRVLDIITDHGPIGGRDVAATIYPGKITRDSKEWNLVRKHLAKLVDQGLIRLEDRKYIPTVPTSTTVPTVPTVPTPECGNVGMQGENTVPTPEPTDGAAYIDVCERGNGGNGVHKNDASTRRDISAAFGGVGGVEIIERKPAQEEIKRAETNVANFFLQKGDRDEEFRFHADNTDAWRAARDAVLSGNPTAVWLWTRDLPDDFCAGGVQ